MNSNKDNSLYNNADKNQQIGSDEPRANKKVTPMGVLAIVLCGIVGIIWITGFGDSDIERHVVQNQEVENEISDFDLHIASQIIVEQGLTYPKTANFGATQYATIGKLEGNIYQVRGTVEYQNGFGVPTESTYYTEFEYDEFNPQPIVLLIDGVQII